MKLRFLLMGCILSASGAILLAARGFSEGFISLLAVGIVPGCGWAGLEVSAGKVGIRKQEILTR